MIPRRTRRQPSRPLALGVLLSLAGTPGLARQLAPPPGFDAAAAADAGTQPLGVDRDARTPSGERQRAEQLIARGRLQTELDEFEGAETSLLEGIDLLIVAQGEFAADLIDPYVALSRTYGRSGRTAEAITVLEHARHISQRNFGLFNLEQASLLEEMGGVYERSGDTAKALETQHDRLNLALRRYGEDDPRAIPYRYHLAEYYERSRMRSGARDQYAAVVDYLESAAGEDDGALLKPLAAVVRMDMLLGEHTRARRRLVEVLELSDNATAIDRATALAVLGDWEMARRRLDGALEYYGQAYSVLAAERPALAAQFFSKPALIDFIPPLSPADRGGRRDTDAWGAVTARFGVSATGQATSVTIVTSTPPGLMDSHYLARISEARFRPRLVAGRPVATHTVRFEHRFRYYAAD
jgi:tetratricopeptide (TPR) repeat protein